MLASAIILVQACNNDDEGVVQNDSLAGTWEIQSAELVNYTVTVAGITLGRQAIKNAPFLKDEVEGLEATLGEISDQLFPMGTIIALNQDSSYLLSSPNAPTDLRSQWSQSKDQQQVSLKIDNRLLGIDGLRELTFDISELDDDSLLLLLNVSDKEIGQIPDYGNTISIDKFTIEYEFSFRKQ